MNVINYRVSLDMLDVISQATIKAKKGDSACKIYITLAKNGKLYKISEGCSATFTAKKSDGNFVYDKCTIEGDTIVYDFSTSVDDSGVCQITACEGIVDCEVTLFKGFDKLTSPRFSLVVDNVVYNGEKIISTPESDVLKELINEANSVIDEVETKLANGEFVGEKGEQGEKGEKGDQGEKGEKGEPGNDGYTPIKGVDYFTDGEQTEFISKNAPSIECEASGEAIVLGDASNRTLQGLNVYGKTEQFTTQGRNKLDLLSIIGEDYTNTVNGVTVKIENGYAVFSGTHTNTGWSNVLTANGGSNYVLQAGTYTSKITLQLKAVADNATVGNMSGTFTIDEDAWVSSIYYAVKGEQTVSLSVPLVVAEGTQELTEYEPYTGGMPSPNPDYPQSMNTPTDVQVKVNGANILNVYVNDVYTNSTSTAFDISTVNNGFRIEAVAEVSNTSARRGYCIGTKKELMGKTITVSAKYTTSRTGSTAVPSICLYSLSVPQGYIGNTTTTPQLKLAQIENAPLTFTIDDSCPYDYIGVLFLYSYGGAWVVGDWSQYDDIQVQIGDTATAFEPYTEQILTVPTMSDIGLAGVPVKEGGNRIDENGQRWVCDEVDFARCVYVQRVLKTVLNGTETWEVFAGTREDGTDWYYQSGKISGAVDSGSSYNLVCDQYPTNYLSNNTSWQGIGMVWRNVRIRWGAYSEAKTIDEWKAHLAESPLTIQYVLAEPVEIPLDEATLSAFSALHTNKPNTTMTNNAGVWMSAEYVADTKLYIDNKFAELASAIISNS